MNNPVVVAVATSLFMSLACGGGDKDIDITDGGMGVECDPVMQDCDAGEKCTSVIVADTPFDTRTACVPDGTVAVGGACTFGDIGEETGHDNCQKGLFCVEGECTEICQRNGATDTCPDADTQNCMRLAEFFAEQELVDVSVGLCLPACDPMGDPATTPYTNCPASQGCFMFPTTGDGSCGPAPFPTKGQDALCDSGEGCFLNACAPGHFHLLPQMPGSMVPTCAGLCNPVNTHTGSPGGAAGGTVNCTTLFADPNRPDNGEGPNGPYQCRFVQTFFGDTELVPANLGFCVGAVWGDCALCDISTLAQAQATCEPGCVDLATEGMIMTATASAAPTTTTSFLSAKKPYLSGQYYGMSMAEPVSQ